MFFHTQVNNLVMFLRWMAPSKDAHEHSEVVFNLRAMAVGIMGRTGAKQSKRYTAWRRGGG